MKSIMHRKDGTCYLCAKLLDGVDWHYPYTEEHHVMFGFDGDRPKSEKYGLKVYLCVNHHRTSREAVHQNRANAELLMADAQKKFIETYPELDWMEIFGKNYLPDPKPEEEKEFGFWFLEEEQ